MNRNMMMASCRRATLALLVAAHAGAARGAEAPLPLEAAIALALKRNQNLAYAALAMRRQEIGIKGAESLFSVRYGPDGDLGVSEDTSSWQYGLRAAKRFSWGTDVAVSGKIRHLDADGSTAVDRTTLRVGLEQPLLRGFGRLAQREPVDRAHAGLRKARRDYEQRKADLVIELVDSYEAILLLTHQIQFDEEAAARIDRLLRLARARERQGRATRIDTLKVGIQGSQAQSRLRDSQERLHGERRRLAGLVGLPPGKPFELAPPPLIEIESATVEEAIETAFVNRLDYAQSLDDHRDAQRTRHLAQRDKYPDVSLVASYELSGDGESIGQSFGMDDNEWFVGLAAGRSLNPALRRAHLAEADVDATAARQAMRLTELTIAHDVQDRLTTYRRSQAEIAIAERNAKLAQARVKQARRLFRLGRSDSASTGEAEEAYVVAQVRLLDAKAKASTSAYGLLRALGTLIDTPDDLKPSLIGADS